MFTRNFPLIYGVANLALGLLPFLPGATRDPGPGAPPMRVRTGYGNFLGLFPTNVVHNLEHVALGLVGLSAFRSGGSAAAERYARMATMLFGMKAAMGLIPRLRTMFGVLPMYGNDVWLHTLLGGIAAYAGAKMTQE